MKQQRPSGPHNDSAWLLWDCGGPYGATLLNTCIELLSITRSALV